MFVDDLGLKSLAVALAVLLSVGVAYATPREAAATFDRVPVIRPEPPQGFVVRGALGDVSVRVRGPEVLVASLAVDALRASVDLSTVDTSRAEPQEVQVVVQPADDRITVVEVAPATVNVRLERLTSRSLPVQVRFANEAPKGFAPGAATFIPAEVAVTGPESVVGGIAAMLATVRFGDLPIDLIQSAQPVPVDAAGAPVEGVTVEPASVQVSVPIVATATTRTVPVLWVLRGTAAPGYWISRVGTDPVAVTVRGDPGALATLEQVETAPIDVGGIFASRSVRVTLVLPEGVTLVKPTDATVTVTVSALTGTRPFPLIAVGVTNLGAGLVAEVDPRTVDVVLSGTIAALNGVTPEQVVATADASGRGPGTHTLDVVVRSPSGTTVQSVQPARVNVTIRNRQ